MKTLVKMAYCYAPEFIYKTTEGGEKITWRKPGAPTRLARSTDVETWYEEKEVTNVRPNA